MEVLLLERQREENRYASQRCFAYVSAGPSFEGCCEALLRNKLALILLCVIAWFLFEWVVFLLPL